jgi:hypothetical protein
MYCLNMADEVRLDADDASYVCETLYCLAKLVNPELGEHDGYLAVQLSEAQRQLLTNPPALVITRSPKEMAERMLNLVATIQGQLGDNAPAL